jgi:hypothetical protein
MRWQRAARWGDDPGNGGIGQCLLQHMAADQTGGANQKQRYAVLRFFCHAFSFSRRSLVPACCQTCQTDRLKVGRQHRSSKRQASNRSDGNRSATTGRAVRQAEDQNPAPELEPKATARNSKQHPKNRATAYAPPALSVCHLRAGGCQRASRSRIACSIKAVSASFKPSPATWPQAELRMRSSARFIRAAS